MKLKKSKFQIDNYCTSNAFEYDDTFPLQFCPVCGSEHLASAGREQPLFSCKESWLIRCDTCNWEMEVFILKKGRKKFKFRQDSANCKECQNFRNYKPKRSLTDCLKEILKLADKDAKSWVLSPDYSEKS